MSDAPDPKKPRPTKHDAAAQPRDRRRQRAVRASETAAAPTHRFIVLTGLSGSGKSQAMRALEDLGYFCVDNLPITLLPTFAELTLRPDTEIDEGRGRDRRARGHAARRSSRASSRRCGRCPASTRR